MKGVTTLSALAAVALTLAACNPAPPAAPDTHDADVKAISDTEAQANQAWATKDPEKVLAFYADDAVLMTPGMDAVHGKDAVRTSLKAMLADPAVSLTFQSAKVDVAKSGDLAYTQGSYKLTVTDPATHKPVNDHGNYVTTFRKQADGSWKAEADIATSEVPPMPPPKKK
ncbi:SgcJ/EcaC family oxidoreductase [Telmatobacter sp. DSM 110680]|uniref:SgcJ/EcaC family oxidoreductase n=1 Tax=Telmatobacter sp. DSM 110680 TaxID=3036704 RepID=A0AAU7DIB6_9BACT